MPYVVRVDVVRIGTRATDQHVISEALSPEMYAALVAKRPRGRPKADETKVFTAIRLDADLLETFKSTGKGWQTRVNAALRQYLNEHPIDR